VTTDVNDEHVTYQPNEEPDTVPQNPAAAKAPGQWVMPEPVFRKTSGILPQGFTDRYGHLAALDAPTEDPAAMDDVPTENSAASPPAPATAAAPLVEAQPDISELVAEVAPPQPAAAPRKKKNTAFRLVFSLLGLAVGVLFLALFLAVVYFLFLAPAEGGYSPF
jgi:hypothetical protein